MSASPPDKLSIIIVNDFAHVNGGAALVALESAKGLAKAGHDVTVFAAVKPIDDSLKSSGVKVVCTDQHEIKTDPDRKRAVRQGLWNRTAAIGFNTLLRDYNKNSTVVHVHGWTKSLSSSVFRTAIDQGFPVVCTLHDYFAACPNGGLFNYRKNEICELKAMSLNCVLTNCDKQSYGQKIYRVIRQRKQKSKGGVPESVRHFISISKFSTEILEPYLPRDATIHPVANPIFIEKMEPATTERHKRFICVARFSPEKGLFLLADAARKARVNLTLVGDGELKEELEKNYPEIEFTGWQGREQIVKLIRSSQAMVLPSLWYETQGMVVAEAAALGVPSIVPDSCAARDMVIDGKTGLWFKGGDIEDLSRALTDMTDTSSAAQMGTSAYNSFWSSPPTLQIHIDKLCEVYRRILG